MGSPSVCPCPDLLRGFVLPCCKNQGSGSAAWGVEVPQGATCAGAPMSGLYEPETPCPKMTGCAFELKWIRYI